MTGLVCKAAVKFALDIEACLQAAEALQLPQEDVDRIIRQVDEEHRTTAATWYLPDEVRRRIVQAALDAPEGR